MLRIHFYICSLSSAMQSTEPALEEKNVKMSPTDVWGRGEGGWVVWTQIQCAVIHKGLS